jgi:hypothetical protein
MNEWMNEGQGILFCSEETCLSADLSIRNPTWLDPGRRGGKPATIRLNYGKAQKTVQSGPLYEVQRPFWTLQMKRQLSRSVCLYQLHLNLSDFDTRAMQTSIRKVDCFCCHIVVICCAVFLHSMSVLYPVTWTMAPSSNPLFTTGTNQNQQTHCVLQRTILRLVFISCFRKLMSRLTYVVITITTFLEYKMYALNCVNELMHNIFLHFILRQEHNMFLYQLL